MFFNYNEGLIVPFGKKYFRVIALAIAGLFILSQMSWMLLPARATNQGSDKNQVSDWCTEDPNNPGEYFGVKFDDSPGIGTHIQEPITIEIEEKTKLNSDDKEAKYQAVTSVEGDNVTPTKVIVKAGRDGRTEGDGNNSYTPPPFPEEMVAPNNSKAVPRDISHVIVCYNPGDVQSECSLSLVSDITNTVNEKGGAVAKAVTFIHPAWTANIPGATWIWGDDPVADPGNETIQTFKKTFSWGGSQPITSAVLDIASDNDYEVWINGVFAGSDGGAGNTFGSPAQHDIASFINPGVNTLEIKVTNWKWPTSDPQTNPAGLLYKVVVNGSNPDCEQPDPEPEPKLYDIKMCKLDDQEFPQAGWTLMLLGEKVEDVDVPVNTSAGINSVNALDADQPYVAIAKGTWENRRDPLNLVDAEYSTEDDWATQMDGFTGFSTDILELQINATFDPDSDWGTYNSLHRYAQGFMMSSSGNANLRIYDGDTVPTVVDGWYSDNFGNLSVSIYEGYAGVTGEDGCVTFTDVPEGDYNVDEIMLDGWKNVSGLGPVTIEDDTTLNVVNKTIRQEEPETFTLTAQKVICDTEQYLPNWGAGGPDVTQNTAQNWVDNSNGHCHLSEWPFQWSPDGVGKPVDNLGEQGGDWTTFTGSVNLPLDASGPDGDLIWFREVAHPDYIPFSGYPVNDPNSAEFYCNNDVLHYDNWEWISNPEAGAHYYCVAWNVPNQVDDGQIQGRKFNDLNGVNGHENGEGPLAGWTITLYDEEWNALGDPVITADDGKYKFDDLPFGAYYVCETWQEGWTQSWPVLVDGNQFIVEQSEDGPVCYKVVLNEEDNTKPGRNFGNYQPIGQLSGLVYEEIGTANSAFDGDDEPLEGRTVWLLTHDSPYTLRGVTTTGSDGTYSFTNLPFGTYIVCQDVVDGWLQTQLNEAGSGGVDLNTLSIGDQFGLDPDPELDAKINEFCYEVDLTFADPTATALDFGNFQAESGNSLGVTDTNDPGGDVLAATDEGQVLADTGQSILPGVLLGLGLIGSSLAISRKSSRITI